MALVSLTTELVGSKTTDKHNSTNTPVWLESFAILLSCFLIVNVTATIDYLKQSAFARLASIVDENNGKKLLRNNATVTTLPDASIVVGDILLFNSHSNASIPADALLLEGTEVSMNESALTGESRLIPKKPGDILLSGTTVSLGSGKVLIIAVGANTAGGQIMKAIYADGDSAEDSPLTTKLEKLAKFIMWFGLAAAILSFLVIGFSSFLT